MLGQTSPRWWAPAGGACQPGLRLRASGEASRLRVEVSADPEPRLGSLTCPFRTGTWPRTLSSATATSSGWRTSCAPTPSRRAGPAAPAPGAWPTSASGRSRARSSGAQVAARPPLCLSVCLQCARGLRCFLADSGMDAPGRGPQIGDLDLNGVGSHPVLLTPGVGRGVLRGDPDQDQVLFPRAILLATFRLLRPSEPWDPPRERLASSRVQGAETASGGGQGG